MIPAGQSQRKFSHTDGKALPPEQLGPQQTGGYGVLAEGTMNHAEKDLGKVWEQEVPLLL
jgi:hypothetical protein